MITKEVNDWINRIEKGNYSYTDIMKEFVRFSRYLTREEMIQIKKKIRKKIK